MSDPQRKDAIYESSPAKIRKLCENNEKDCNSPFHIKDFELTKIIYNNTNRKTLCVLGNLKEKVGTALIVLEKNAFREEDLTDKFLFSSNSEVKTLFENDIYGNYELTPGNNSNGIKTTLVFPATDKHIQKYSQQELHIISETPELYASLTLPHLEKEQFNLKWVYNILEGKSEVERIVYDNPDPIEGLVLLPDLKWDGKTKETLYLLAIVRQHGIKSLRDLNGTHLPLLKRIRDEGKKAILDEYAVLGSQLRIYLHYQPSFYHLHVHFTYIKHEAPGIYAEKSHLLETVIDNIEIMPNYYQKATLPFVLKEMDNLFNMYEQTGLVQKIKPKDVIENDNKQPNNSVIIK